MGKWSLSWLITKSRKISDLRMCYTGTQVGSGGGMEWRREPPVPFLKIKKEILIFWGKKDPDCVHHSKIFLLFLTKCLSSALIPLNLPWKISGCTAASFFYEHGISLVRDHYVIIFQYYISILFSLSIYVRFYFINYRRSYPV